MGFALALAALARLFIALAALLAPDSKFFSPSLALSLSSSLPIALNAEPHALPTPLKALLKISNLFDIPSIILDRIDTPPLVSASNAGARPEAITALKPSAA